jgi:hypothetical protein
MGQEAFMEEMKNAYRIISQITWKEQTTWETYMYMEG